jgi:hypothetical protein
MKRKQKRKKRKAVGARKLRQQIEVGIGEEIKQGR